jgi:large subunit ribosomal protein L9
MKLILLKDVKKVGKKDEIVDVSDGYGRNFLLAKKLAVVATGTSMKVLEKQNAEELAEVKAKKDQAIDLKNQIEKEPLKFMVKAGEGGRVFNSVSSKQIVSAMLKKDFKVDKRKFIDYYPIQTLGFTEVKIELFKDVICVLKVQLVEAK